MGLGKAQTGCMDTDFKIVTRGSQRLPLVCQTKSMVSYS